MTLKICKWLFLLLIVSLPLVRPFNTQIFGLQVPFTDFIFLGVSAFWVLALVFKETRIHFDKLFFFIGLYGLTLTLSTIFSTQPEKSVFKLLGEFYLFALAFITFNLVSEKTFYKQIVIAWLIGTGLTVLASIAGFILFYLGFKTQTDNYLLSHFGSLPAGNYPRIHALFSNANMMCNFLNVSLVFVVLAEYTCWLKKFWARFLQLGIWFAAFFTFSAGVGGMFLSLGVWFYVRLKVNQKPRLANLMFAASIGLALVVFISTLISPDTKNTTREFSLPFSDKKIEASVRVLVWENAFENFKEFPFLGKGTGTNAAALQYQTISGNNQLLLDAHNVWLNVIGQSGLLGLSALLLLTCYLIIRCRFVFDKLNEQNLIHLALSCAFLGAFLYQGLSGSFEDARHLWILFGMLAGISTFSANDISQASREP
jgi:hypothetical protein